MLAATSLAEQGLALYARNLRFLAEEAEIRHERRPTVATPSRIALDLRTMAFQVARRVEGHVSALFICPDSDVLWSSLPEAARRCVTEAAIEQELLDTEASARVSFGSWRGPHAANAACGRSCSAG